MSDNQDIKIRLKSFIKYHKLAIKTFEENCGLSNGYVSSIRKGIGHRALEQISERYPELDTAWLLTGHGEMLKNTTPQIASNQPKGVPYYDIDVTATNIESFSDMAEVAEYNVDFKPFNDCIAMLPVVGDSMYPEFKNGDIIAIKEAPTSFFLFGETHLVITKDGYRTVKKIRKHPEDNSKVILKPVNPNYDAAEIDKDDIVKLYVVKGQFKTHSY